MRILLSVVMVLLVGTACSSNMAEVQDEELANEQELIEENADEFEEDTQDMEDNSEDNQEDFEDQQIQGENQQFQNETQQNQQFQNETQQNQQFQNETQQNQQFQNETQQNQQFQNETQQNQQFQNETQQNQQFQNQMQQSANELLLNEGNPTANNIEGGEAGFTEVDMAEGEGDTADGVAATDAEGVPPPNEFSGAPAMPGTLKNLASGEAPAEYRIQPGDSLYDICEQLLGEATYWPKLWAMNNAIKNPHFVYPDFVLQFFPGDANQPPSIRVVGIEELAPEGKLDNEQLVAEETAKLFKKDEESDLELLNPEDIVVPPEVEELFRDDETTLITDSTLVQLPALILAEEVETIGEIVGGNDGSFSIQDGQYGFVQGGQLESGGVYTVLRYQGAIYDGLQRHGYRYDFVANLRVGNFTDEAQIARAQVFNSLTLTRTGDIVVEYRARSRKIPHTGMDGGDTQGRIINLTHTQQAVGSMGDFAFLAADVGSDFAKNQVLKIFKNFDVRDASVQTKGDTNHHIGNLQIIEVTDQGAIAYIINNNQEILLGDTTGSS